MLMYIYVNVWNCIDGYACTYKSVKLLMKVCACVCVHVCVSK